jgi:putative tryptophan/tyrosine transport system substrate-binding protein
MKRREFITAFGGASAATMWPFIARSQQPMMPVIGFLGSRARGDDPQLLTAFRQGLKDSGFVEGQNVAVEYRFAENQYAQLPTLATELVARRVAVIVANGPAAQAAKAATATIPIVFSAGFDPVEIGLVASLNQPGGNITGVTILDVELGPKRLELLHEIASKASTLALLVNPTDISRSEAITKNLQAAAQTLGLNLPVLHASTDRDLETAFTGLGQLQAGGLVIGGDPFFNSRGAQLGALSIRHAVPAIFQFHAFAAAGGLVSYGGSLSDAYHTCGVYAGRILKGEKPGDLAVQRVTKVEMIVNLQTAKSFGLSIPLDLIGRADEVIE